MSNFLCLINRHKPRDRRADWDGSNYISKCGRCGERIKRLEGGRWVKDDRPGRGQA